MCRFTALAAVSYFSGLAWGQVNPPAMPQPNIYSEAIPVSSGLPYDAATDTRESFVAPNGKTVQVLVKGPVGVGTYSRARKPGETVDNYFPAVVQEAMTAKAHRLVIPKDTYNFAGPALCEDLKSAACQLPTACNVNQYYNCAPHWMIGTYPGGPVKVPNSVTDLEIDLSGSVLNFNAPVIGIWLLEAQRVRIKNFTIDWPQLRVASLGTIVQDPANPGHNALVIDPQYPVDDRFQGGTAQIQAVDVWDDSTESANSPGVFDPSAGNLNEVYFIFGNAPQPTYLGKTAVGEKTYSCRSCHFVNSPMDSTCSFFSGCANFDQFAPGTRVVARHYTYNGIAFLVNWSNDIDIENATMLTGPGNGFMVENNGGYRGFRLHNSQVVRAPGRPVSVASGDVDITLQADVIVDDNTFAYQGDDAVSVHPNPEAILGVDGAQVSVAGYCDPDPMDSPVAGDLLAFYDVNFRYKTTVQVKGMTGPSCGTMTLQMNRAVANLNATDQIVDLTQQAGARWIIRHNVMKANRGHGVLANASYGLIDQNGFDQNSMGAIALFAANGLSPGANDVVISNNTINAPARQRVEAAELRCWPTTRMAISRSRRSFKS